MLESSSLVGLSNIFTFVATKAFGMDAEIACGVQLLITTFEYVVA